MSNDFVFTSESVTQGHPDKLCDQISDSIVDHYLRQDRFARVVAECALSSGILFISVNYRTDATVDVANAARAMIRKVGYRGEGFNAGSCTVMSTLVELPGAMPIGRDERDFSDADREQVDARDQATVFGYACDHTPELMPLPIMLANKLSRVLDEARHDGSIPYLAPDGKTQVGVAFEDGRPVRIHGITLVSSQHEERRPKLETLRADIAERVVLRAFEDEDIKPDEKTQIAINPQGAIVHGGPALHTGLTGHKNGVDTYGEFSRQSGSALSGKDPSRIDRTGVYVARHAAKCVIAAGLASECEVALSYGIGQARPVSIRVRTFGTGKVADEEIARRLKGEFDFRPAGVIANFELRELPIRNEAGFYRCLASYGHLGRTDLDLPWERADKADALK